MYDFGVICVILYIFYMKIEEKSIQTLSNVRSSELQFIKDSLDCFTFFFYTQSVVQCMSGIVLLYLLYAFICFRFHRGAVNYVRSSRKIDSNDKIASGLRKILWRWNVCIAMNINWICNSSLPWICIRGMSSVSVFCENIEHFRTKTGLVAWCAR